MNPTLRALFSWTGFVFVVALIGIAGAGLVGLGFVDIDDLKPGDSHLGAVSVSGDALLVEVEEGHEYREIVLRHEQDRSVGERPLSISSSVLAVDAPRFNGTVRLQLAGDFSGFLCSREPPYSEAEKIEFPSNKFVVAGVVGSGSERTEKHAKTVRLDVAAFECSR